MLYWRLDTNTRGLFVFVSVSFCFIDSQCFSFVSSSLPSSNINVLSPSVFVSGRESVFHDRSVVPVGWTAEYDSRVKHVHARPHMGCNKDTFISLGNLFFFLEKNKRKRVNVEWQFKKIGEWRKRDNTAIWPAKEVVCSNSALALTDLTRRERKLK